MGGDKEMELMLKITAKGEAALRELKKVENVMNRWADNISSKASLVGGVFGVLGKGVGLVLKPLEWAGKAALGLTAGLLALGGAALKAASDDQKLIDRLTMVYGSAEEATKVFQNLEKISLRGPFKADDLAEATIVLKQFGMAGDRNLGAVANAARLADESVGQMAMQVMALQARGLKRMGIEVDTKDGKFIMTWKDKMGQVQKIVAKGADEARKALIDIMAMKGGVGMGPKTFADFTQMLRNNIDQAFSTVGAPLLDLASRFVGAISAKLTRLIESGKLEEMGKKAAAWLQNAWNEGEAFFKYVEGIWKELDTGGLMKALGIVMDAAARILADSFVIYLRGLWSVFAAIGEVIAAAIGETLLKLPGMGTLRGIEATSVMAEQDKSGNLQNMYKELGITSMWDLKNNPALEAKVAMYGKAENAGKTLNALPGVMRGLGGEATGNASEIMRQAGTDLNGLTGGRSMGLNDWRLTLQTERETAARRAAQAEQEKLMAKTRADAEAQIAGKDLVTYTRTPLMMTNAGEMVEGAPGAEQTTELPGGRYRAGQTIRRGMYNIYINTLVSAANRSEQLIQDVQEKAGSPAFAAAGG
jgi:hypothetical protein